MSNAVRQVAAGAHTARTALLDALTRGELAPGQRLVETELAERFEVTRASVRAALIELTSQGLVERIPNRGARVRTVSVDEAVAITECRMVLEGLCAAKAAQRASDADIAYLNELGDVMREAVAGGQPSRYSETNRELHRVVRALAGQTIADEMLERLNAQLVRHQFRLSMRDGRSAVSLQEHLAIIDAISQRDPDRAEQVMRDHLRSVADALRSGGSQPSALS